MGVTLSGSPLAVAGVNTAQEISIKTVRQPVAACQADELLPRETSAVRLRVDAFLGPRVTLAAFAHGRVISHGERGSGWTGGAVTIPVNPLPTATAGVDLCFMIFLNDDETAELVGEPTAPARAAHSRAGSLPGRVRVEYMRPGSSWWALAPAVAHRMGLGRAASGTWSVFVAIALMAGVALACSRAILRWLS
jgi:hypothetical protein